MMNFSRMGLVKRLHFVGIGGIGMSGIAEVLLTEGYQISGSDAAVSPATQRLEALGAKIYIGHERSNVNHVDVVVRSSAIDSINPEIQAAQEARIPVVQRAAMLAELMRFRYGIAIAGTHGKTTTTSLCASILAEAGLDPTFVIGGKLNSHNVNARLGKGKYLVAEADESDASFLMLNPMMSVVTNIDADHLENYGGKFSNVKQAFIDFLHRLPFYGLAVLCGDDPVIQELLPEISRPVFTYGEGEHCDIRLLSFSQKHTVTQFILSDAGVVKNFELNLPGKHNVLNALATYIIAKQLGINDRIIQKAMKAFSGVGRRFQHQGNFKLNNCNVTLIDDYGHHPVEVAATFSAAKLAWPDSRIILVFQPHRYTRTVEQFDAFSKVLSEVSVLLLLEVYSAGETYIEGASSHALANSIRQRKLVEPIVVGDEELETVLSRIVQEGDIILTMGAGSIGKMSAQLAEKFKDNS
jgi:UDP-N-acetylmuramate--alanine ligase